MTDYAVVRTSRDRAATGRMILAALTAIAIIMGLVISGFGSLIAPRSIDPAPQVQATYGDRQVIAVGQGTRQNRCDVRGLANGVPLIFEVDTGDPDMADFPASYVSRLKMAGPLNYTEWWPGTRYGKIATTTLREIRIGDVVWDNPEVNVFSDWDFSFGDDEIPLFGLAALKMRGINVEFEGGGNCRLTVAPNRRAG